MLDKCFLKDETLCFLLTGDQCKSAYAGEGGHIQVHPLKAGGELNNTVDPLAEAPQALQPMPHRAIAEDELSFLRV